MSVIINDNEFSIYASKDELDAWRKKNHGITTLIREKPLTFSLNLFPRWHGIGCGRCNSFNECQSLKGVKQDTKYCQRTDKKFKKIGG